jgi:Acyclic terpene utilisation family protein AtuA
LAKIIRIAGAGGFLGDSQIAMPQLLSSGKLDYVILDYLAEATMSVLARAQLRQDDAGFARDFVEWVWKDNLGLLKARGVRLVTNAGGLNPAACRARMEQIAAAAGLSFNIAIIEGDDLRSQTGKFVKEREMFSGAAFPDLAKVMSINAYFGAKPIAEALADGADVVITGRVVDSALVLGPLVKEFGWAWDDYDLLAAGSLCGHVLECGAQATGGLFTDWEDVPDWAHIGYPIAECKEDGSFVVTKPAGTGGLCTSAAVAEQILYEIADPRSYELPDVIADFTQVRVQDVGPNRVAVTGAVGRPPSGKYKVCVTYHDGWRCIAAMPIVGRDAARKAQRQAAAVVERVNELLKLQDLVPFRAVRVEPLGAEVTYGAQARRGDTREVVCKIGVEHEDRRAIDIFLREFESPVCSMSVGTTGWFGGRPAAQRVMRVLSFLLERAAAPAQISSGGRAFQSKLAEISPREANPPSADPPLPLDIDSSELSPTPLVSLAWARSGDKGDAFNIGVIARRPEFLPYIRAALTEQAVMKFFAHEFEGARSPAVTRYEVAGLHALNFHCKQALGGGQMASLRLDPLAKGKAQQLLDIEIPVPVAFFPLLRTEMSRPK